jgi:hypothetical protein
MMTKNLLLASDLIPAASRSPASPAPWARRAPPPFMDPAYRRRLNPLRSYK